ncbi:MAG: hypothetical protein R2755_02550 [Acidimicrobiales bacterium]
MAYNTEAVLWGAFIEQNQEELLAKDGTITVTRWWPAATSARHATPASKRGSPNRR